MPWIKYFHSCRRRIMPFSFPLLLVVCGLLSTPRILSAQTFKILYSFKSWPDGNDPDSILLGPAGRLYGTTYGGGASYNGTAFELLPDGKETVLYNFVGGYGSSPNSQLVRDPRGMLYGTTYWGGAYNRGTVFKVDEEGNETVLHSFRRGADGGQPEGVIRDRQGNLYGTTLDGGPFGNGCCGTVFKLDPAGKKTVLYNFTGGADGGYPSAGVIRDSDGNLYGTTHNGGDFTCDSEVGCGTVFKVDSAGKETVLLTFIGKGDGAYPAAPLFRDKTGALYGTTTATNGGGDSNCATGLCGTVFRLDLNGKETVLHRFTGVDGEIPSGVVLDAARNIYGTTMNGGYTACMFGCGIIFMLDKNGKERILHTFSGGADGAYPSTGAVMDAQGNIYGTTKNGGDLSCQYIGPGCGTVFKLTR